MSYRHIQPARVVGPGAAQVDEAVPTAAVITLGAPVRRNSGTPSTIEEHPGGATVTGFLGFAMQNVSSAGTPDFGSGCQYAVASSQVDFFSQVYDSGGAAVRTVAGDGTFLGVDYGLIEASTFWYVDEDDVTNVVADVVKELPGINGVLFRMIGSAISA